MFNRLCSFKQKYGMVSRTYAVISVQGLGNIKTFIKFLNLCNYFILSTFGISCLFLHKDCHNSKNGKRATEKIESHSTARVLLSKWMLTYSKWWNECTAHWTVVDGFLKNDKLTLLCPVLHLVPNHQRWLTSANLLCLQGFVVTFLKWMFSNWH